eukprot:3386183-Alexandrium_andersonii.AAC.1
MKSGVSTMVMCAAVALLAQWGTPGSMATGHSATSSSVLPPLHGHRKRAALEGCTGAPIQSLRRARSALRMAAIC